eukprot:scaffold2535_cov128-Isochrysis_galbana.AAC.3
MVGEAETCMCAERRSAGGCPIAMPRTPSGRTRACSLCRLCPVPRTPGRVGVRRAGGERIWARWKAWPRPRRGPARTPDGQHSEPTKV